MTMCQNLNCKKRMTCYRFVKNPNPYWQSYQEFDEKDCKDYLPTGKTVDKPSRRLAYK